MLPLLDLGKPQFPQLIYDHGLTSHALPAIMTFFLLSRNKNHNMKRTTEILIQLPDYKNLESLIGEELPKFEIRSKSSPNIWEFRNHSFKHSLYYNSPKSSKLISVEDKLSKRAISWYAVILVLLGLLVYFKMQNKFEFDFSWYMILSTALTVWIMTKLGSGLKHQFEDDHNYLVEYFSKYEPKN